ncbi:hypothetical protein FHX82_005108 [Amycolatopsis bartoniae]|uniref:hypothetical protein n=1 Tax=Amycolatopsis bartoniae TaxID=941986 RepID=UPI0011956E9E|nr:hypothetical protein [Amycolatopsis bartoniae]MBB2938032.1 hypothetical protein [Amycolatopsis bartoniae]TVT06120.1 hypothetical protein FNH07_21535 [Amycolatopsis bartoniae]
MAVPRYGVVSGARPPGAVEPPVTLDSGITELRVHGVGGTTPDALLRDLAPRQAAGDRVAGFYRTDDLPARGDVPARHVEAYSWGGLTSRSGVRVLWLLLVPFLLANLAGWMYRGDGGERPSGPWFAWHRVTANLACLALTVNAVLVAVLIGPDLIAFQATRAGLVDHRPWLWPWQWTWVAGHGERPLVIGFALVAVGIGVLVLLALRTQSRYESVLPPWRLEGDAATAAAQADGRPRTSAADTTLTDPRFWNSARAVRRMTGAHVAAALGFLTVTFAVTARAASPQPRALAWWWVAIVVGALVLATSAAVVAGDHWAGRLAKGRLDNRPWQVAVHVTPPAGLVCAGVFALLQPQMVQTSGSLPGVNGIVAATYAALAAAVVLMALGALARRLVSKPAAKSKRLVGGPVVVTVLAAGLLNSILLSVLFTVGHTLGSFAAEPAGAPGLLAMPLPLVWAGPVLTVTLLAAIVGAILVQLPRLRGGLRSPRGFDEDYRAYAHDEEPARGGAADEAWYVSAVPRDGDTKAYQVDAPGEQKSWRRKLKWTYRLAEVRSVAAVLIWLVAVLQTAGVLVVLVWRPPVPDAWFSPNGALGKVAIFVSGLALAVLMWLLRQGWRDPARRRQLGVLWDVGTFWPRSYHPFAPPCYAERAVPDLQRRIWRLNDHGSPVVLVGHSQGAVLSAVALLPGLSRARQGTIGLVTFGNPVSWLYSWAFSGWLNPRVLDAVLRDTGGSARVVAWRNFWYPTDPIGNSVTVERPDPGRLHDECLPDPPSAWHVYGDPPPSAGGHSGYWTDARVWSKVDALSREIAPQLSSAD